MHPTARWRDEELARDGGRARAGKLAPGKLKSGVARRTPNLVWSSRDLCPRMVPDIHPVLARIREEEWEERR